jgi:uncharacterized protein with beta-barrel porin domain
MSLFHRNFRAVLIASVAAACFSSQALAASFTVAAGGTDNTAKTVVGGDTGVIGIGGTLSAATPITWSLATANTAAVTINNSGTVNATGSTRGIDTSGSGNPRSFTFNNLTAASILTATNDAFRINSDIGAGTVIVNNAGTIQSTTNGRALSFNAGIAGGLATIQINNSAGGVIQAAGDDAIRPGTGNIAIVNGGTIQSTAASGRAINLNTTNLTSLAAFALTNNAGGLIQSQGDAVRITATNLQAAATYNVSLDNFGTIKSIGTGGNNGQAIDFNDLVAPTGTVTITNETGGVISAADADAVRSGNHSTINNHGTIQSFNGTPTSTGNDGIDFQSGNSGTVNNFAGGAIIGARHGITGDLAQVVNNDGVITGQAGSGINIDSVSGTTIVNNTSHGVITGTALNGDGDGIDVDYLVNVNNSGTIQAVGTFAGETNEALAIGGGSVVNNAGGVITSVQRAITVDDSNLGNAFGAVSIDNAGTITGQDGEAIRITSILANTLTNRATGVINGSVVMGAGNDSVNLYAGSTITGTLDGGAGSDTISLFGPGSATFAGASNFETLSVQSGSWALTGTQSYSAATAVAGGATLGVTGMLNTGTLNFASGATYKVAATPATLGGTIAATGALTLGGGTVAVTAASGAYANSTQYVLLTAASTTGTFAGATVNLPFLAASLGYTGNSVTLTLTRNTTFLTQQAVTPNEIAVARALDASPTNSALFLALVPLTGAAADAAFDSLSGEIHASLSSALIGETQDVQDAVLGRLVQDPPDEPAALWLHGVGSWRALDGAGGTFGLDSSNGGLIGGYDAAIADGARLGFAVGYSSIDAKETALASRAHANALDFMLYGESDVLDALHLRAGAGYTHYFGIHTARTVTLPTVQTLTAAYNGEAVQGFVEASYRAALDGFTIEPLLDVNATGLSTGAFAETGGSAAVSGASQEQGIVFTTLGARLSADLDAGDRQVTPRLLLGWRHAFGDTQASVAQIFQSTGTAFTVAGTPLGRDSGVIDAGLDASIGPGLRLGASYTGQFSQRESSNGVNLTLGWNF